MKKPCEECLNKYMAQIEELADYQEYLMLPNTFNRSPAEQVLV